MKPTQCLAFGTMALSSLVCSANEKPISPDCQPATAHLLSELPDGTPPPPEPAKPPFVAQSGNVINTETRTQGGRSITVQEILPIQLPQPESATLPPDPETPLTSEQIAELRSEHPQQELLMIGASVIRSNDSPVRSLVTLYLFGGRKPVMVWSSADFAILTGFTTFVGTDGQPRYGVEPHRNGEHRGI